MQSILLVEDSVKYYSTYLPTIYKAGVAAEPRIREGGAQRAAAKRLRKRARPKILLATNYAEAVELYEKYKNNLLG